MYRLKSDTVACSFGIRKQVAASFAAQSINSFPEISRHPHEDDGTSSASYCQDSVLAVGCWDLSWKLTRHMMEDNESEQIKQFFCILSAISTANLMAKSLADKIEKNCGKK